jgi:hypothetical protein
MFLKGQCHEILFTVAAPGHFKADQAFQLDIAYPDPGLGLGFTYEASRVKLT